MPACEASLAEAYAPAGGDSFVASSAPSFKAAPRLALSYRSACTRRSPVIAKRSPARGRAQVSGQLVQGGGRDRLEPAERDLLRTLGLVGQCQERDPHGATTVRDRKLQRQRGADREY